MFGLPEAQALLPIEPRQPCAGGVTIEKVSSQVSGSLPDRATGPEPSSPTVALVALAVGAVPACSLGDHQLRWVRDPNSLLFADGAVRAGALDREGHEAVAADTAAGSRVISL